jgi:predicted ATPase/DNA-binding SARP family transcriptional activator
MVRELRITLLGGFQVMVDGRPVVEEAWRLRRARSIVKLLALAPGHRLHRDEALEWLWPDHQPEAAIRNLHQALHAARRALTTTGLSMTAAATILRLHAGILSLEVPEGLRIDLEEFEAAAERARTTRDAADYEHALLLYSGELLPEDRYEDWAATRRIATQERVLDLLTALAALHESAGRFAAAIAVQQRITAIEPTREEAHRALLRLYAYGGERAQVIRQYRQLREILRRELETEPDPMTQRLYREILAGQVGARPSPVHSVFPLPGPTRATNNLPVPLTSFVGRGTELGELKRLIATTRLLTLTGAGGCGKTRLALVLAGELVSAYCDGVWLVELASLTDGAFVARTVAGALGVREEPGRPVLATLTAAVRARQLLLILDNCEHLRAAVADLACELLAASPGLRILGTSREPLGISGELVWRVPLLALPPRAPSPEQVLASDASRLFVERAYLSQPAFRLTEQNAPLVAQLCHRLDGLPLAIELAAARLNVLSIEQIVARLDSSLRLLRRGSLRVQPRQQTLEATLDWSYALLSEPERAFFRRLAAFVGSFDLEAVEAVCVPREVGTADGLDLLTNLVSKSLVEVDPAPGSVRYRLLEPIRQYARSQTTASGELATVERHHAHHYLAVATRAATMLWGDQQVAWLDRIEQEYDNLRAALRWSICHAHEDAGDTAVRFLAALRMFWEIRGYFSEGEAWLEEGLACSTTLITRERALALQGAGGLARVRGKYPLAARRLEESLRVWRELGDPHGVTMALHNTALVLRDVGQYERAVALLEEALPVYREREDPGNEARCLINLGRVARDLGDQERAVQFFEAGLRVARAHNHQQTVGAILNALGNALADAGELARAQVLQDTSLAVHRQVGDQWGIALATNSLARLAYLRGDYTRATALHRESLRMFHELGIQRDVALCLGQMAELASTIGHDKQAARLFGAEEQLRATIGSPLAPVDRPAHARCIATVRARLGETAFAAAWEEGRALNLEEVIATVLAEGSSDSRPPQRSEH